MFKKALAILLLVIMALPAVSGLGEEAEEEKSAFETLRDLMETQFSPDIPVAEGEAFKAPVIDDEEITRRVEADPTGKAKESDFTKTPTGLLLCEIRFEDAQKARRTVYDKDKNPIREYKIINSSINDDYEYEAVRYNHLTLEQMLYYAYVVSSNYDMIQQKMPYGESFAIVIKFGNEILLINDSENAAKFSQSVIDTVMNLANASTATEPVTTDETAGSGEGTGE